MGSAECEDHSDFMKGEDGGKQRWLRMVAVC